MPCQRNTEQNATRKLQTPHQECERDTLIQIEKNIECILLQVPTTTTRIIIITWQNYYYTHFRTVPLVVTNTSIHSHAPSGTSL
mmetsp:Transcript_14846/g.34389  ORF Transcript_14846/g.34389 Transcript_14846/m.34389 type:complete len:84 (-) Transcript_14846:53-304(-)